MTQFINISQRYGDAVGVTISDYRQLNPSGQFEERRDGIYEYTGGIKKREGRGFVVIQGWLRIAMTWAEWEGAE